MSLEKQQYLQHEEQTMNKAIDLSHHLSDLANARQISPLKGLQKFIKPDAIQFAGGELPLCTVSHLFLGVSDRDDARAVYV